VQDEIPTTNVPGTGRLTAWSAVLCATAFSAGCGPTGAGGDAGKSGDDAGVVAFAPVLDLAGATPNAAVNCIDDSTVSSLSTVFGVTIADEAGATDTPLTARWFVNYSVAVPSSQTQFLQDELMPVDGTTLYGFNSHAAVDFRLPSAGHGIYAVEVVVSDAFDDSATPAYRTPKPGHYATTLKWVVNFVAGTGCSG
jgi:hypothetical protein